MNKTNQKKYWVGADVVFIPGREAGELAEVYGITDPERQEVVLEGVATAIGVYLSDPEIVKSRSNQPSAADIEAFIASGGQREMPRSQSKRPLGKIALGDETIDGIVESE